MGKGRVETMKHHRTLDAQELIEAVQDSTRALSAVIGACGAVIAHRQAPAQMRDFASRILVRLASESETARSILLEFGETDLK